MSLSHPMTFNDLYDHCHAVRKKGDSYSVYTNVSVCVFVHNTAIPYI